MKTYIKIHFNSFSIVYLPRVVEQALIECSSAEEQTAGVTPVGADIIRPMSMQNIAFLRRAHDMRSYGEANRKR